MSSGNSSNAVCAVSQDAQIQALTNRLNNTNGLLSDVIDNVRGTIARVWGDDAPPANPDTSEAVSRPGAIGVLEDEIERYESRASSINALVNRIGNVA